jgi:hypothetical protein
MKTFSKRLGLSIITVTALSIPVSIALADDAGENEWLLPTPTMSSSSISQDASNVVEVPASVQAPEQATVSMPKPSATIPAARLAVVPVNTAISMPGPQIVEIKSSYVNRDQASDTIEKKHFQLVLSYAVSGGKTLNINQLSKLYFYYLNQDTQKIGVAVNREAAKHLTMANDDVYSARRYETLSQTLARWADKAGYQIEWLSSYNYRLQYSYEFIGDLVSSNGPLNQILQSIAGSNYALKAEITENHIILIKDNEYSPSIIGK